MINELPPAPSRGDDADVFVARADAFIAALPGFAAQVNSLATLFNLGADLVALGYLPPVLYAVGLSMTIVTQTVQYGGNTYAPKLVNLPFTTSGVFEADKFRLIQGVVASDLAASSAAATIGRKSTIAGAVASTVEKKFTETVSIQDVGGADDFDGNVGTNNVAAFENLCGKKPVRIRLPYTKTGVYLVDSNVATQLVSNAGVVLDPDPGVSIYVRGTGKMPFSLPGIRSTRELRIHYQYIAIWQTIGPRMFERPAEQSRMMSTDDGELHTPISLSLTSGARHVALTSFPSGNLVTVAPGSVAADYVDWGVPAAGQFVASTFPVVPGDQIMAELSDSTYLPGILIQTDSGWFLARQQVATSGSIDTVEKAGATASIERVTQNPVLANSMYQFKKAMIGACIFDSRSFGLVVNGIVIRRYQLASNIVAAGWAGGFGSVGTFVISNPVMFKRKRTAGIKPLKIVTIGDSTGDRNVTQISQFELMAQYLAGAGGCQVETLTNLATAGETTVQQRAKLEAINLTGYDLALFQIGANNVQAATGVAAFLADIEAMVTYTRGFGVEPIVGIPAMWYSSAAAQVYGQVGAATGEVPQAKTYRLALMRKLAELSVYANTMVIEDMGAIVPSLLALPNCDPILSDNIHPNHYGTMLEGYSWAKTVATYMTGARDDTPVPTLMPIEWFAMGGGVGSTSRGSYTVDPAGNLTVMFGVTRDGATVADGAIIATLPARFWPCDHILVSAASLTADGVPLVQSYLSVSATDGTVRAYKVDAAASYLRGSSSWQI